MAIGVTDMKSVLRFPGTWDLEYLKKFNGVESTNIQFDELAKDVVAGFNAFNQTLISPSNFLSAYIILTTEMTVEYDVGGGSDELKPLAEHGRSDSVQGDFSGHMLPMRDYGGALAWTYWALRRASQGKLTRDLRILIDKAQNTWNKRLLTRMFSKAADTVGGTGKSVPFADGGSADANYVPLSYAGKTFDNTHNHFLRVTADDAGRKSALDNGGAHLAEHGITGPYDLLISEADISAWTGLSNSADKSAPNFIKPERGVITMQNIDQRAAVDEQQYIGVVETPRTYYFVRPVNRIPTNYAGIFRPRGLNAPDNPLAIRYEPGFPLGLTMVADVKHFPFEGAQATFTFGAGVNKREAGVPIKFASSGTYSDPVIG